VKILLASTASYEPPRGGSTRSNLAWLRALVRAGHHCRVVCGFAQDAGPDRDEILRDGIEIVRVRQIALHTAALAIEIERFAPDWVLASSEDLGHTLLREAHRAAPGRLVYLAHTPQWFPFGPESWHPDPEAAAIVKHARAVVAIGRHMAGYIRQHLGREVAVIHPPIYGGGPWPDFAKPGAGSVLLVNPCAVKGIRILLGLADRLPAVQFTALTGWGTTVRDRADLARRPNIQILDTVPSIDDVLQSASILLMPSLWYEGFGLIAMEAMLRGLPVLASDSGGLAEAKLGTSFVVPVRPIQKYFSEVDDTGMPVPDEPEQDLEPWVKALRALLEDRAAYTEESRRSRAAAENFVRALRPEALGHLLAMLGQATPLRILLAHNSLYFPSHGGGDKSNRILMKALAARGHEVRVVARVETFGAAAHERFLQDLADRGVTPDAVGPTAVLFHRGGVEVHCVTRDPRFRSFFETQIHEFDPNIILCSTDDPAHLLFEVALHAPRARVVYLVRATIALPFGPDASSPNASRTVRLQRADAVVTVSEYVAEYCQREGNLDAVHLPISIMPAGDPPRLGSFENPYVVMVNPCAVKGISIFAALAREMPHVEFAAVPTWGTTKDDRSMLESLPNVRLIGPYDDIDELFRQTKVMLIPSVWAEARSRIALESIARGVPTLVSDIGGLPEAVCRMETRVPITPVHRYKPLVDENMVPVAEVPPQDIGPWRAALERLLKDRSYYDDVAERSWQAARNYMKTATEEPFEQFLGRLARGPKKAVARPISADSFSPVKKRLLELRLRQRAAARSPWFPRLAEGAVRVFAFGHAGAGALFWRDWPELSPVLLPGREARFHELPFEDMTGLVDELAGAIEPFLDRPYAFFGHSMGAGIAFELARELRRLGRPLPKALVVSGARAPRLRRENPPALDQDDDRLIREVEQWGGIPTDPVLRKLLLPVLRADTDLYRRWRPLPGDPLESPVFAYGGEADRQVQPADLQAWQEETSADFKVRLFSGGHLYLSGSRQAVIAALREDVALP